MEDIWNDYLATLKDLIRVGLENNDVELLNGIQSLEVSVWMGLEGPAAIMQSLILRTADMKKEAEEYRQRIDSEEDSERYTQIGVIEAIQRRVQRLEEGRILLEEFLHNLRPLSGILDHLISLRAAGLVELRGSRRDNATVKLSISWDGLIEGVLSGQYDLDVFPYSLGKMIAMAIKEQGIGSLKPIIRALNESQENNGTFSTRRLQEFYNESNYGIYHFDRALCRDRSKDETIRLFDSTDPRNVIFTQHSLRVQREWLVLARERGIRRLRGL